MREAVHARAVNPPKRGSGHGVLGLLAAASARVGLGPLAGRLVDLRDALAGDIGAVEQALGEAWPAPRDLAERAGAHLLARPGKRIRPLCVFLAARMGRVGDREVLVDLAVASELVHAATLLHDDVIDLGTERRGAPAAAVVFGNAATILGGDHLLVQALRRVSRTGHHDVLERLLITIEEMVAGEAIQLERRGRFEPDREAYDRIVAGKTASLFAWSLGAGAVAGGLGTREVATLERVGRLLGLAFQLVDDALDLAGRSGDLGKDRLRDSAEAKLTWPIIVACERDPVAAAAVARAWGASDPGDDGDGMEALAARLLATGCVTATRERARGAAKSAREALDELPSSAAREALAAVIEVVGERAR